MTVRTLRKVAVFIGLLCLVGAGACLIFWDLGASCFGVLIGRDTGGGNLLVAADEMGEIYVLEKSDGRYRIVRGDISGKRNDAWTVKSGLLPLESEPVKLYPTAGGTVYLGLYDLDDNSVALKLYKVGNSGKDVELIFSEPCFGQTMAEAMAGVRLSDYSVIDGTVHFAVIHENAASFYRINPADQVAPDEVVSGSDIRAAIALPDGEYALVTGGELRRTGRETVAFGDGEVVTGFAQAGTGVYYMDFWGLRVFYASYSNWLPYAYLDLEKSGCDLDGLYDMAVTRDGDVLLLINGGSLWLVRDGNTYDLSGMLRMPAWQCVLVLLGLLLAVAAVTMALWYVLCERRRLRIPMLISWSVLAVAVAAVAVAVVSRFVLAPACRSAQKNETERFLESAVALQLLETDIGDGKLPELLGRSISQVGKGEYRDTEVEVFKRYNQGVWVVHSSSAGHFAGARAETVYAFDAEQAERAWQGETYLETYRWGDETRFVLCVADGELMVSVDVGAERLLEAAREHYGWMIAGSLISAAVMLLLMLILLIRLTFGLGRVARGMERLAAGERDVKVPLGGGDELESLARDVNALSDAVSDARSGQDALVRSYRRFVPEKVLSLLGKGDISQIDKRTSATRHLAAMLIDFRFPRAGGTELFDNINEIINRTAPIVVSKGGTVFGFGYHGYYAVFEGGSAAAVSTAVAVRQNILSLNRGRENGGRPPIAVGIALDEGDVTLGVVGDDELLEPVPISPSFSVARHLISLCGQLDAGILCTQTVLEGAAGYASRYMGKCREGDERIRVYEIFDADPYETRKIKEQTSQRFSEGVYTLYGGDFSKAKSIFLNLVRRGAADGGARYYLYLADRLEKEPCEDISLEI